MRSRPLSSQLAPIKSSTTPPTAEASLPHWLLNIPVTIGVSKVFSDQELIGLVKAVARLSLSLQQLETMIEQRDQEIAQLKAQAAAPAAEPALAAVPE